MPFSKFEPDRAEEEGHGAASNVADRRAKLLQYGWWISVVYTAIGFAFIAYWLLR